MMIMIVAMLPYVEKPLNIFRYAEKIHDAADHVIPANIAPGSCLANFCFLLGTRQYIAVKSMIRRASEIGYLNKSIRPLNSSSCGRCLSTKFTMIRPNINIPIIINIATSSAIV